MSLGHYPKHRDKNGPQRICQHFVYKVLLTVSALKQSLSTFLMPDALPMFCPAKAVSPGSSSPFFLSEPHCAKYF